MVKHSKSQLPLSARHCHFSDGATIKCFNEVMVDGIRYAFHQAYVASFTLQAQGKIYYYKYLYFVEEGVSLKSYQNYDALEGNGKVFYLSLRTTSENALNHITFQFSSAVSAAFYQFTHGKLGVADINVIINTASLNKSGNIYMVDLTAQGDLGRYTLHYKGGLQAAHID